MYNSGTAGQYSLTTGTTMDGEKCVELLKENLAIHKYTISMHDGAPYHPSKKVKNYPTTANVTTPEWPVNSSDLKSMENQWEILNRKFADNQS